MRLFTFTRFMYQILKKRPANLDWIQNQGLLAVKLSQIFALRPDLLSIEKCKQLQTLYGQASTIPSEDVHSILKLKAPMEFHESIEWFDEEGIDEEEIQKRILNEINQEYKNKRNKYSQDLLSFAEKRVMLFQIDKDWREHLAAMDNLRSSVNLRAMGGKDPFYEYKKESFEYFNIMLSLQNEKVLQTLFKLELVSQNEKTGEIKKINKQNIITKKIGRNNPCPCGSNKKYKNCHGN